VSMNPFFANPPGVIFLFPFSLSLSLSIHHAIVRSYLGCGLLLFCCSTVERRQINAGLGDFQHGKVGQVVEADGEDSVFGTCRYGFPAPRAPIPIVQEKIGFVHARKQLW
jgi:hypothetical protein